MMSILLILTSLVAQPTTDHYANLPGDESFDPPAVVEKVIHVPGFGIGMTDRKGDLYYLRVSQDCLAPHMANYGTRFNVTVSPGSGKIERGAKVWSCQIDDVYRATPRATSTID